MQVRLLLSVAIAASSALFAAGALAESATVVCESKHHKRKECSIPEHSAVRIKTERSNNRCRQGHNWDYDRDRIWVDDNCKAEFLVEHSDRHRHSGERQHGSGQDIPGWAVGRFTGRNKGADVRLDISDDGAVKARVGIIPVRGRLEGDRLLIGNDEFVLHKAEDGFRSVQVGNRDNEVRYYRD